MIRGLRSIPQDVREWNTYLQSLETYGTATVALTGFGTPPTGTIVWCKFGRRVTLTFPEAITGTSNATSLTLTGLPLSICPASVKRFLTELTDNGTSVLALGVLSGTTITFHTDAPFSASGWTNSGSKGVPQGCQMGWILEV